MTIVELLDGLTGVARIGLGLAAVGRPGYITLGRDRDLPRERTVPAMRERAHRLLDEAYAAGRAVIVKEALANGRLAAHPGLGPEPDVVALAAVLHQPWVTVVLSGAATTAQLASNLRAASVAFDPAESERLTEPAEDYWRARAALPWR